MDCWRVRDSPFSVVTRMSACFRTWLDALCWLPQACSLRPTNTQQRRIQFDSCQERSSMDCERVREPRFACPCFRHTHVCVLSFMAGASVPRRHTHVCVLSLAGRVRLVRCDRRTHNRGVFSSTLAKNGVAIRPAGLEAPEQIERVERRGDMLKKMMSKGIKDTHASGRESMDMILSECLSAANEMTRRAGFAPAQWVLSRLPRSPATMSRCGCSSNTC